MGTSLCLSFLTYKMEIIVPPEDYCGNKKPESPLKTPTTAISYYSLSIQTWLLSRELLDDMGSRVQGLHGAWGTVNVLTLPCGE